ncbi:MAG: hypothetical protein ACRBF0_17820 [Calditrichia bacterium]
MKFLPKDSFCYRTPMTIEEATAKLEAHLEPQKMVRMSRTGNKAFEGELKGGRFNMWRILNYKNSFAPQINGRIEPDVSGSRIDVHLFIHPLGLALMGIIIGMALLAGLVMLLVIPSEGGFNWRGLLPIAAIPFATGMMLFGFNTERDKTIVILSEIFGSRPEKLDADRNNFDKLAKTSQ